MSVFNDAPEEKKPAEDTKPTAAREDETTKPEAKPANG